MKKYILSAFLLTALIFSCKKNHVDPDKETYTNVNVNEWIYTQMKDWYLWEDQLPTKESTSLVKTPDAYFESLLYNYGEVDRFSWIQESSEELKNSLNGITTTFGLNFQPIYADNGMVKVVFPITYVLKGSAAEKAGILRGDIITKVNGVDITATNYTTVLSAETVTLTFGKIVGAKISDTERSLSLTKVVTEADPVQFETILELEGKKIGYLVYTQFLSRADESLNKVFGKFKSAGIDELVVDLRFNPGGYISSSELLSSLIVKNLDALDGKLMTRQIWNTKKTKELATQHGDKTFDTNFFRTRKDVGSLNYLNTLDRVFFLVSGGTASASELVINNLKPFMDVVLIGANTYGKNVGSITIEDNQKRWKWGMQPIVLKSVNANGASDYGTKKGFIPDIAISDRMPYKTFGDTDETLLHEALSLIVSELTLAKARKSGKITSGMSFQTLGARSIADTPLRNRTDMWLTKLPGQ